MRVVLRVGSSNREAPTDDSSTVPYLQRADQEAARNRDANAAAIAALGGGNTSVQKRPWTETNPFEASAAAGLNAQTARPRTKRVNSRDLQLVLAADRSTRSTPLRYRLALFSASNETAI